MAQAGDRSARRRSVLFQRLFARKPIAAILPEAGANSLPRLLGRWDLTGLGIGAIIGAGIFAATGSAISGGANHVGAGPGIVVSFVITGLACAFAALCYAELAAMVPVAGSAYTYSYVALGEFVAWIIGWDLILEYAVGNIAVAISWSGYFTELLRIFGLHVPVWLETDYRTALQAVAERAAGATDPHLLSIAGAFDDAPRLFGVPLIFNLPAFLIVALVTVVLVVGVRAAARSNGGIVLAKVGIVLFFIAVGSAFVQPENFTAHGGFFPNGWTGVSSAAAIIFFAYIGFDAVSTAAEEAKDPGRTLPFGILMSLAVCTVLYILVAIVMVGMAPWNRLGTPEPMVTALEYAGGSPRILAAARVIVALGAVLAMTSVLMVFQLGQPRIFFSMARDGLLPRWAAAVHPRFRTPWVTTILTGTVCAFCAGFANINEVVELTNIGTLFAFALVAGGVLVLRRTDAQHERPFRVPFAPWTPLLAIVSCVYLMLQLPAVTWIRFVVWLLLGIALYFSYGIRHRKLAT